ncbi:DeoR family transcriptional regulator [Paenibacillus taihuensis]|uniref:DeoR family transcriptional regulator n=1 Tax=Paenibacillus taihuensis TaxID=1156355 RepID=A0A3D9RVI5_9BACL|nr:DeoR/GlpR family DNA-binding transcription regulator [Paenibacillus taihuensis]REE83867.1 DeoR family transcriptional regulator [Paenibacillus taihuensis]
MFANERRINIIDLLEKQSSVTVAELMTRFHVSIETVRRDLEFLEKQQALRRVHGGAVSISKLTRLDKLESRLSENISLKQQLSRIAVRFIRENDTIAIDSGSTALELAALLKENFRHLTVVTNSPEVFEIVSGAEDFEVILIGGQYLREEKAFYGHLALDAVSRLHYSKVFVFPNTVSLRQGAGIFVHELFDIQRAFIQHADEVFILADSSKFETTAAIKLCDLLPSYRVITDSHFPDDLLQLYKKRGIQVHHSEEGLN